MTTRRVFVATAGAAAVTPLFIGKALAQSRIELRAAHPLQTASEHHKMMVELAETIAAKSQRRITVKVFPAAQLGSMTNIVEQASQGEPVIAFTDAAYLASYKVPEFGVLSGPFLTGSEADCEKLANSALLAAWERKLTANAKLHVLALNWFEGPRHILGSKPFPEPADLRGIKIRVPPVPTWRKTFEPLGAIPTTVEFAETYSALSQGVVQAVEQPLIGIKASRFAEVAKNLTLTGHFRLFLGWVLADKVMQSLAPEDRTMLVAEFRNAGRVMTARGVQAADAVRKEFESQGVKFTPANIAAYRAATRDFYNSFPDWPAGLYDQVQAALKA